MLDAGSDSESHYVSRSEVLASSCKTKMLYLILHTSISSLFHFAFSYNKSGILKKAFEKS